MNTDDTWFQQDWGMCHMSAEAINLLSTKFGDGIISRNGPVNWPQRSCDFFLNINQIM